MQKMMFNDRFGLTQTVIEGRKTVTRREPLYTDSNNYTVSCWPDHSLKKEYVRFDFDNGLSHKARYAIGEVVAVAQSYNDVIREFPHLQTTLVGHDIMGSEPGCPNKMFVRADLMPHRIRITGIRCERLQDISDEDCIKEGIEISKSKHIGSRDMYCLPGALNQAKKVGWCSCFHTAKEAFASLIDKVSVRGTWEHNPWVVVYEFETLI